METLLQQFRQKFAHGLERDTDIGAVLKNSAIVQAKNRAPGRANEQAGDDGGCLPFPV